MIVPVSVCTCCGSLYDGFISADWLRRSVDAEIKIDCAEIHNSNHGILVQRLSYGCRHFAVKVNTHIIGYI